MAARRQHFLPFVSVPPPPPPGGSIGDVGALQEQGRASRDVPQRPLPPPPPPPVVKSPIPVATIDDACPYIHSQDAQEQAVQQGVLVGWYAAWYQSELTKLTSGDSAHASVPATEPASLVGTSSKRPPPMRPATMETTPWPEARAGSNCEASAESLRTRSSLEGDVRPSPTEGRAHTRTHALTSSGPRAEGGSAEASDPRKDVAQRVASAKTRSAVEFSIGPKSSDLAQQACIDGGKTDKPKSTEFAADCSLRRVANTRVSDRDVDMQVKTQLSNARTKQRPQVGFVQKLCLDLFEAAEHAGLASTRVAAARRAAAEPLGKAREASTLAVGDGQVGSTSVVAGPADEVMIPADVTHRDPVGEASASAGRPSIVAESGEVRAQGLTRSGPVGAVAGRAQGAA
mmetsp:Transcript_155294/g.498291  ORF Transcript_155294/g.498291 Transcript_155294/m.498291 type:complete len:401 (+) Transcript_155294:118-1320(+)